MAEEEAGREVPVGGRGGTVSVGKRGEGGGRGGRISRGSRVGRKGHDSRTNVTIYFHYDIIRNETRDSMPSPLR